MKKLVLLLVMVFNLCVGKTVMDYVKELEYLDKNQSMALTLAYWKGRDCEFELTLTAIIWKESSFGRYLSNSKDGKYGSFGIAQILLETAMKRNNVRTNNGRKYLKMKLLTDHVFNLDQAIEELNYWKKFYKPRSKYWLTLTLGSYNAGWKSIRSKKGEKYAKDVLKRIKALKYYFKHTKEFNNRIAREHLKDIQADLRRRKII